DRRLRWKHFDGQSKGALLRCLQRTDVHHLARHFLAAVVADGDDDEVLEGLVERGMADHPFHTQRRGGCHLTLRRFRVEAQVVHAARADAEAFENRRLAVRTGARLARGHRARGHAHEPVPYPLVSGLLRDSPSAQPNSTWPRMRDPAATVSEPAFTSPLITPPSSS